MEDFKVHMQTQWEWAVMTAECWAISCLFRCIDFWSQHTSTMTSVIVRLVIMEQEHAQTKRQGCDQAYRAASLMAPRSLRVVCFMSSKLFLFGSHVWNIFVFNSILFVRWPSLVLTSISFVRISTVDGLQSTVSVTAQTSHRRLQRMDVQQSCSEGSRENQVHGGEVQENGKKPPLITNLPHKICLGSSSNVSWWPWFSLTAPRWREAWLWGSKPVYSAENNGGKRTVSVVFHWQKEKNSRNTGCPPQCQERPCSGAALFHHSWSSELLAKLVWILQNVAKRFNPTVFNRTAVRSGEYDFLLLWRCDQHSLSCRFGPSNILVICFISSTCIWVTVAVRTRRNQCVFELGPLPGMELRQNLTTNFQVPEKYPRPPNVISASQ